MGYKIALIVSEILKLHNHGRLHSIEIIIVIKFHNTGIFINQAGTPTRLLCKICAVHIFLSLS